MSWKWRFRLRGYTRRAVWLLPVLGMLGALVLAPVLRHIDAQTRWTLLDIGPEGARALLGALSASLLTFIVFAFSILLLAVQLASGQLSPRIIVRVFERRLTRLTLAAFIFSYTYATATLGRIEDRTPQLPVLVAVLSGLFSIVLFVRLTKSVGLGFRPVAVLTSVAHDGREMIERLYPKPFGTSADEPAHTFDPALPVRTILHRGAWGALVDFDDEGLVELASNANCTIELVPGIGDFIASGEAAFRLRGPGAGSVPESRLHEALGLGSERAPGRDLAFAFRIIVDIASKALSPAINDPTTGVLAIDQLQHLLHQLGRRQFAGGVVRDRSGIERLFYRSPTWDDYVMLASTEIRLYGATSPQVTRRLMAMFELLVTDLPAERGAMLIRQRSLLKRTIEASLADPEDRASAAVSDLQGFGSPVAVREGASA